MIAAASVSRRRRVSSSAGKVPGNTVSTCSPSTKGVPRAAEAALTEVMPGMISASNRSASLRCMCMYEL